MTDYTYFPDVSNLNGKVNLTGAPACIAKATEGNYFVDDQYLANKAQMIGRPFAAYHWLDTADIASQADHCLSVVGTTTPIMTDAEALGATVDHIAEFTRRVRFKGGICTLTYLPEWYWERLGKPDLTPLVRLGLNLISSNYVDMSKGFLPYGGMTPAIHQYSDSHSLNGTRVDFNRFPGTVEELHALFTGGEVMANNFLACINSTGTYVPGNDVVFLSDGFRYRGVGKNDMKAIGAVERLYGLPMALDDMSTFLAVCGAPYNAPDPTDPVATAQQIADAVVATEAKKLGA